MLNVFLMVWLRLCFVFGLAPFVFGSCSSEETIDANYIDKSIKNYYYLRESDYDPILDQLNEFCNEVDSSHILVDTRKFDMIFLKSQILRDTLRDVFSEPSSLS